MVNLTVNITPRMVNIHAFNWLKRFAENTILLESALDAIERELASDYDSEEWLALTYCLVMDPSCWKAIEVQFTQRLGIEEPNLGMSFSFSFSAPSIYKSFLAEPRPEASVTPRNEEPTFGMYPHRHNKSD